MTNEETLRAWMRDCDDHIESGISTDLVAVCPTALREACRELLERRIEVEKYKAWAASCDPAPVEPSAPRFKVGDVVRAAGGAEPRKVIGSFMRYRVELSNKQGYVCIDEDQLEPFTVNRTAPHE